MLTYTKSPIARGYQDYHGDYEWGEPVRRIEFTRKPKYQSWEIELLSMLWKSSYDDDRGWPLAIEAEAILRSDCALFVQVLAIQRLQRNLIAITEPYDSGEWKWGGCHWTCCASWIWLANQPSYHRYQRRREQENNAKKDAARKTDPKRSTQVARNVSERYVRKNADKYLARCTAKQLEKLTHHCEVLGMTLCDLKEGWRP